MGNTNIPDIYSKEFLNLPKEVQLEILQDIPEDEFNTVAKLEYDGVYSSVHTIENIGPHYIVITESGDFGPYQSIDEAITATEFFYITEATQSIEVEGMEAIDLLKYADMDLMNDSDDSQEIFINGQSWTLSRIKMYKENS